MTTVPTPEEQENAPSEAEEPEQDKAKTDMSEDTPKTDKPQPNVPHHPPPLDPAN